MGKNGTRSQKDLKVLAEELMSEEEPLYCSNCGSKQSKMISRHILQIKHRTTWDNIDKQVREHLALGKGVVLCFTKKGILLKIITDEELRD